MVTKTPLKVQLIAKREAGISGTSRYTEAIQRGLLEAGVDVHLTFPAPPPLPSPMIEALNRFGVDLTTFLAGCPLRAHLDSADIYHIPTQTMATLLCFQRFPRPVVVTVLDIIPHLVRGDRGLDTSRHGIERLFYRLALAGLKRADALIAISEYTKRTLVENLGLPSERIHVVYPAVDPQKFRPLQVPDEFLARHGLGRDRRYVLYVGSDDPRKNLGTLAQSFALLKQKLPQVKLLKVGAPHFYHERQRLLALVADLGIQEDVLFIEQVSDNELPLFYNVADVLAMPSLYEGFCLPVAEAMACGTPVVCSNATSLPEAAGGAALLVDPTRAEEITLALQTVLDDSMLAADLRRQGLDRAAALTHGAAVDGLLDAYRVVLDRQQPCCSEGEVRRNAS